MMNDYARRAYLYYLQQGWTPEQAAALAGNIGPESSGNPNAVGDGGKAYGLYQWHPDRQAGLTDLSEQGQLAYAHQELGTTERRAGDKLRAADSVPAAVDATMAWLRPAGYTPGNPRGVPSYGQRLQNAYALYDQGGIEGIPPSAVARMRGADGGAALPDAPAPAVGMMEAARRKGVEYGLLTEEEPSPGAASAGASYGAALLKTAAGEPEPLPPPRAELYRPKAFKPITLKGLL